jgi:hypothetical protein
VLKFYFFLPVYVRKGEWGLKEKENTEKGKRGVVLKMFDRSPI